MIPGIIDEGPLGKRSEIEIEFPEIRKEINELCQTPVGREMAGVLTPSSNPDQVRCWLEETDEIRRELERGWDAPSVGPVDDIRPLIIRTRKGAVLRPDELMQISRILESADSIRRYVKSRPETQPRIQEHFGRVSGIPKIQNQIRGSIDPSGNVRDEASAELARLRKRRDSIEEEIKVRIQELVSAPGLEDVLQDHYFTLRVGRYVMPVKSERRSDFKGIIHDFSSSGATVFIEPESVVDLNNQLRIAEGEVVQEEERILKKITTFVEEELERLGEIFQWIGEFDLLIAKARLSHRLGGGEVGISEFPSFLLRSGRHPLLVLQKPNVVANDVSLDGSHRGIVISGPNTGGKTVTLKMVGISAAMFQSGIIPALGDGSRLPVFRQILAVIGEAQSLARGLSAFAAEVVRVREVMDHVGPGTLVLLDDLFGGTDPREGAILAQALLKVLIEKGGVVLVTTHFPELKMLPLEDSRFEAAAVEFDLEKMTPTYRVRRGIPGKSYGLEIAGLLGLGDGIIHQASRDMEHGEGKMDEILARLHQLAGEHTRIRDEIREEQRGLENTRRALEAEREEIARRKSKAYAEARRKVQEAITRLEREAKDILQKLRESRTKKQTAERLKELRTVQEDIRREAGAEEEPFLPGGGILEEKGPVWVKSLKKRGVLFSLGTEDSLVQVGSLKIRVKNQELVAAPSGEKSEAEDEFSRDRRWREAVLEGDEEGVDFRTEKNSIDVRGENVEDAVVKLEKFLDQAYLQGLGQVFIIHGSGSGKLREGIRKYLDGSPYAGSFRAAEDRQGGQGVTIVELK